MEIQIWLSHLQHLLEKVDNLDLGYPLGKHRIYPPVDRTLLNKLIQKIDISPSSSLIAFYANCDGISLPDIHNGYFIHGVASILNELERGAPTKLASNPTIRIVSFGSDGGGGQYAIRANDTETSEVLYLPSSAVHNSMFDDRSTSTKLLAPNFPDFLSRLEADLNAFLADDRDWNYMS